jgi:hypothetical protein
MVCPISTTSARNNEIVYTINQNGSENKPGGGVISRIVFICGVNLN